MLLLLSFIFTLIALALVGRLLALSLSDYPRKVIFRRYEDVMGVISGTAILIWIAIVQGWL